MIEDITGFIAKEYYFVRKNSIIFLILALKRCSSEVSDPKTISGYKDNVSLWREAQLRLRDHTHPGWESAHHTATSMVGAHIHALADT